MFIFSSTVTDINGCSVVDSVGISEPAPLHVNTIVTHVSGYGGSDGAISASVSGGTPPYQYSWSNGADTPLISGLPAGVYSLTVTDSNHCQVMTMDTVTQPSPVCANVDSLWTTRITPTSVRLRWTPVAGADHYIIRGRKTGTSNWQNITVQGGNSSFKDIYGLYPNFCYEWQIKAFCTPDETLASLWSALDTFCTECVAPDTAYTYPVTANAARLNWSAVPLSHGYEIKIKQAGGPWFTYLAATNYRDIFNLQPNTTYQWKVRNLCDDDGVLTSAYTSLLSFTTSGTGARLAGNEARNKPLILPNPNHGKFTLIYENDISTEIIIKIFNTNGEQVFHQVMKDKEGRFVKVINIENQPSGIYLMEIITRQEIISRRILIE